MPFKGSQFFLLGLLSLIWVGCGENTKEVEAKLPPLLQDDLQFMVAEVLRSGDSSMVRKTPIYRILDLKHYPKDSSYTLSGYAEVEFIYLAGNSICQTRKYRYLREGGYWDRYEKRLKYCDTTGLK
jgi:hypothetical protein